MPARSAPDRRPLPRPRRHRRPGPAAEPAPHRAAGARRAPHRGLAARRRWRAVQLSAGAPVRPALVPGLPALLRARPAGPGRGAGRGRPPGEVRQPGRRHLPVGLHPGAPGRAATPRATCWPALVAALALLAATTGFCAGCALYRGWAFLRGVRGGTPGHVDLAELGVRPGPGRGGPVHPPALRRLPGRSPSRLSAVGPPARCWWTCRSAPTWRGSTAWRWCRSRWRCAPTAASSAGFTDRARARRRRRHHPPQHRDARPAPQGSPGRAEQDVPGPVDAHVQPAPGHPDGEEVEERPEGRAARPTPPPPWRRSWRRGGWGSSPRWPPARGSGPSRPAARRPAGPGGGAGGPPATRARRSGPARRRAPAPRRVAPPFAPQEQPGGQQDRHRRAEGRAGERPRQRVDPRAGVHVHGAEDALLDGEMEVGGGHEWVNDPRILQDRPQRVAAPGRPAGTVGGRAGAPGGGSHAGTDRRSRRSSSSE